jgi:hypothetical protein
MTDLESHERAWLDGRLDRMIVIPTDRRTRR